MSEEMSEAEESCQIFTDAEFRWIGIILLALIVVLTGLIAADKL